MTAQDVWAGALAEWSIPKVILAAAPASPWDLLVDQFAEKAARAVRNPTPSHDRAREALPAGGSVLDVGCGAGAASLPLQDRAGRVMGIDPSPEMLYAFRSLASARGVSVATVAGTWPESSTHVDQADVVVCHHVAYNVPDLGSFALALGEHARHRVVLELTVEHPLHHLNELWLRFHDLKRPDRPTVDDALALLRETGIKPHWESWQGPPGPWFWRRQDLVTWVRTRVCLKKDQDAELDAALDAEITRDDDGRWCLPGRAVATVWWDRPHWSAQLSGQSLHDGVLLALGGYAPIMAVTRYLAELPYPARTLSHVKKGPPCLILFA